MRTSFVKVVVSIGIAVGLGSGCVNAKLMEFTYQELDTVKTQQDEILQRFDQLSRLVEAERDERVRTHAETALTMQELREALERLSYRIDDLSQMVSSGGRFTSKPRPRPEPPLPVDTARVAPADTSEASVSGGDSAGVPPPVLGDGDADKLFKGAYMDLTLGNYDLAVQGFKNYLIRYPEAANMPEAHYYLGESYFSMSRYLESVGEYQAVIREFPRSRYVAAAYLKSGFCYDKLEESELARRAFRELISRYPRTEEAEQARVSLKELGG